MYMWDEEKEDKYPGYSYTHNTERSGCAHTLECQE